MVFLLTPANRRDYTFSVMLAGICFMFSPKVFESGARMTGEVKFE
jgi:hypothetical protein